MIKLRRPELLHGIPASRSSQITVNRVWLGIFGVWLVLLSGVFAHFVGLGGGSPGVVQALRLNALLANRRGELGALQGQIDHLNSESDGLERSRATQYREIRKVLGYAGDDDIIFDFNSPDAI